MSGYVKKIAVIKQIKSGFSADGGLLSGLVKAETYAGFLKIDVSLINFAPLSEGRYVFGFSDGNKTAVFDEVSFECESDMDISDGFAFLVCFVNRGVALAAGAECGNKAFAFPQIKEEISRAESAGKKQKAQKDKKGAQRGGLTAIYDDEAISEVNYYEREACKDGQPVRTHKAPQKKGRRGGENEEDAGALKGAEDASDGGYYERMKADIENIFARFPPDRVLEEALPDSRFARIAYGGGKYYSFGVVYVGGKVRYICYAVPSHTPTMPPRGLKDMAGYIACADTGGGYWVVYQDADTGVTAPVRG